MRVLVARPREDAERTGRALAARGHEAVLAPVLQIERTDEPPPVGRPDAVILTSSNAIPALASLAIRMDTPIFTVGERTGSAAAAAGFADVRIADGDAAKLSSLVARSLPPGTALLHVTGRERKAEPSASLAAAGYSLSTWAAYEAIAARQLSPAADLSLREGRLDAALHYSRRSAEVLLRLAGVAGFRVSFLALAHVCLSTDAAAPLRDAGAQLVRIAARPAEDALLEALDRCAGKSGAVGSRGPHPKC